MYARQIVTKLTFAAAALFAASPLAAQCTPAPTTAPNGITAAADASYRVLRVGSTVRDTLTADDETIDDGSHVRNYDLSLTEGQRVTLVLTSRQMEAVLMISLDEDGAELYRDQSQTAFRFEVLRGDEDDDGNTSVRITFTAPATGHYTIGVDGMTEESVGAYQLAVQTATQGTVAGQQQQPTRRPAGRSA